MSLSVIGMGLVTPAGCTPTEHAFFLRAGVFAPPASAFVSPDDEPLKVRHCEWLGAHAPIMERLEALGVMALDSALTPIAHRVGEDTKLTTALVATRDRPGLDASSHDGVRAQARARRCRIELESSGAAGVFDALSAANKAIADGVPVVVILAVDSFVSAPTIDHEWRRRPSDWQTIRPPPSEGAAALVVCSDRFARDQGLRELGRIRAAATAVGAANDDNDDPADGAALTYLVRQMAPHGPFDWVVGPHGADELRHHDLHLATARNARSFTDALELSSIESTVGLLGSAAGLADIVHGLATLTHDAASRRIQRASPFLAWAISRDGTRGVAVAQCSARGETS